MSKFESLVTLEKKRKNIETKSLEFISLDKKIKKRNLKMSNIKKIRAQNYINEFQTRKNVLIKEKKNL